MSWNLRNTASFQKSFKSCPPRVRKDISSVFEMMMLDPWDKSLRTHRLRGKLSAYYSMSIDDSYRMIVRIDEQKGEIVLMDIGDHDIYDWF